ncbi:MAG: hypothetical protein AAB914_04515 [Patescibacteria group bacterium]
MANHILHIKISRKDRKLIDQVMMFVSVIAPLLSLPQAWTIYANQNAENVSLFTWVSFLSFATIYLLYGIIHKIKPLIITNILWIIVEILVVVGILVYG